MVEAKRQPDTEGSKWTKWGARLGVVVSITALCAAVWKAGDWLLDRFEEKRSIVVRGVAFLPAPPVDRFDVRFSVVNGSDSVVYINQLYLLEGPLRTGPGPMFDVKQVPEFHDVVIVDQGVDEGESISFKPGTGSPSPPKFQFSTVTHRVFSGRRLQVEAKEQVDYSLEIRVLWGEGRNRNSISNPYIPACIAVKLEDDSGARAELRSAFGLTFP